MTPLNAALSPAKSQPRWTRGRMSRRRDRDAWNRSRPSSLKVLDMLRANPPGLVRNRDSVTRACLVSRVRWIALMVAYAVGASPVKRLLTETPSSTSSPRPSECLASIAAASAGLFATYTRPSARSTHRNAGIPSMVPCRMPIWLAGVVAGSLGFHSAIRCEPVRIHRPRVGSVPARTPHSSTGNGTPSAWMKTMPGTSASGSSAGRLRRAPRRSPAVTASSVPAVATHTNSVETAATTHDARKVAHSDVSSSVGTAARTAQMMKAWLKSPIRTAPTQPSKVAMTTRTGLSTAPITKMKNATTRACSGPPMSKSGTIQEATTSPSAAPRRPRRARPRSPHRRAHRPAGLRVLAMARAWRVDVALLLPRSG